MGEGQVEWDEDVNVKRGYDLYGRSLEKRAGKARNFKFCDDQGQAADNFLMVYNSPAYPNGNDALCYDAENWATDAVYKLKVGKTPAKDPKSKHSYIDEHILELQTLKWFLHSYMNDKAGGLDEFKWKPKEFDTDPATKQKRSYCEYFHKYWDEPLGAKPKGKKKTTAFDFVATAFPSKTAHGDELVMLENNTNAVKAQMFKLKQNDMVAKEDLDTYELAVQNLRGMERLVERFKYVVLMMKYMNDPKVNDIYKKQAIRIGDKLEEAEKLLVDKWKNAPEPYKKQDLKAAWMKFAKEHTDWMNSKVKRFYDRYKPKMEEAIENYPKTAGRKDYKEKFDQQTRDERKQFYEEMKVMVKEVNNAKSFKNPF
ncbi:uncharacterized protein PG998_009070 [Apiospora kogelbergensis]|uniref:uncharacterized protein n=1 Tax=Apiospora kogelbergensis TaxID=1337665 RepID=UPI00312F741B